MRKKFGPVFILTVLFSLALSACAGAAPVNNPQTTASTTPTANSPASASIGQAAAPANLMAPQDVQALFNKVLTSLPDTAGYGYIQAAALKANLGLNDAPFLLDVRDPAEIAKSGFIQGAVNIPLRDLLNNLDELPAQNAKIVIYSNTGYRSGMALAALMILGYTDVRDLAGGFSTWVHTQYPVVTGTQVATPQAQSSSITISNQAAFNMLKSFLSSLPANYYQVDAATLSDEISGSNPPTLVDINTASDHEQYGHIQGAIFIPFNDFFNNLDKLPSMNTPIVIYAVGGGHSSILIMGLREMGYTNVFNLKDGIQGWKAAQYPTQPGGGN